ncbi:U1 zinc finger-domain-containing protein [Gongronella butleri]|nr:U1 zinc finger-domain-containing protein [Gongronella butleri]
MPKYYCEYCDVYLTHDSPSVRKGHNLGRNHINNVRAYYTELNPYQTQAIVNEIVRAYEVSNQPIPNMYNGSSSFYPERLSAGPGGPRPPFMPGRPGFPPFGNMSTGPMSRGGGGPRPPPYGGGAPRPPMPHHGYNGPPPPSSRPSYH